MPLEQPSLHDAIIVGTGPAGAMLARELARAGRRVLVLEQGGAAPLRGTLAQMAGMAAIPGRGAFFNADGSLLVRGITAGGSSAINFATAMAPPMALFDRYGVDLRPALAALQRELPLSPLPDELIGPMAMRIMAAARKRGHAWNKLPKMIHADLCRSGCWRCVYGCPFGAKWSARDPLDEAVRHGAQLLAHAGVRRVLIENGRATGVEYQAQGQLRQTRAPLVVLAAGGIGSPRILAASGLRIDARHFTDPVIAVMGSVDDIDGGAEVPMAAGMHLPDAGITLSDLTLPRTMYQAFALQVGRADRLLAHRNTLTIMVKIRDALGGRIGPRWVSKPLTPGDREKFAQGVAIARGILLEAGAKRIFQSWHFAAHPGGSVRIGDGVGSDLQTPVRNLYVCDASVIPGEWGLPPTLTLLCMAWRLGQHLVGPTLHA
ncbi:GMC family oxidoreductase N-terminal domain-containing protein [Noviherbaspirillum pedocola]|uniref:GMC family oxidoreductase n=1 Tax=Noviherbaspirillum pedocola TaxID=2801341 RepID=A0A934W8U9_9BURK|nr:GMC family oxidoreductase [Noviherbaspirillum pedocola]MBK4737233.1 GMC family oxidoreductase [Noviherbaspirillum pedocola]